MITRTNLPKARESITDWKHHDLSINYNTNCLHGCISPYMYTVADMLRILKHYEVKHWWKSNSYFGFQGDGVRVVVNYSESEHKVEVLCSTNPHDYTAPYLLKSQMPSSLYGKINDRVHDVCEEMYETLNTIIKQVEEEEANKLLIQKQIDESIVKNWS